MWNNFSKIFWELNKLFATPSLLKFCFYTLKLTCVHGRSKLSSKMILLFQWCDSSESLDQMLLSLWFFLLAELINIISTICNKTTGVWWIICWRAFPNLLFNNKYLGKISNWALWTLTLISAEQLPFKLKYL